MYQLGILSKFRQKATYHFNRFSNAHGLNERQKCVKEAAYSADFIHTYKHTFLEERLNQTSNLWWLIYDPMHSWFKMSACKNGSRLANWLWAVIGNIFKWFPIKAAAPNGKETKLFCERTYGKWKVKFDFISLIGIEVYFCGKQQLRIRWDLKPRFYGGIWPK